LSLTINVRSGKWQIAEFIQNYEVEPGQIIGEASLAASARFAFKAVHKIDDIIEAAPARVARKIKVGRCRTASVAPARTQPLAMAIARWDLPVPVPPIITAFRCSARKSPPASARTNVSLTADPLKSKSLPSGARAEAQLVMSLASGSLAIVI